MGVENDATRALAAALRKEKLHILAIGPATNVATVLKNHPELASQIIDISFCAGRQQGQAFKAGLEKAILMDYNFEMDVEAFRVVLDSGVKVVLSGFECSSYLFLGKVDYEFLSNGSEGDKWVYEQLIPWSKRNELAYGTMGFIPYDTTPLGYYTHPEYFRFYEDIPTQINFKKNDATVGFNRPAEKFFLECSYQLQIRGYSPNFGSIKVHSRMCEGRWAFFTTSSSCWSTIGCWLATSCCSAWSCDRS